MKVALLALLLTGCGALAEFAPPPAPEPVDPCTKTGPTVCYTDKSGEFNCYRGGVPE